MSSKGNKICVSCNICGGTFSRLEYFKEHWKRCHMIEYGFMDCPLVLSYPEGEEDWAMGKIASWRKTNFISPYSGSDLIEEE